MRGDEVVGGLVGSDICSAGEQEGAIVIVPSAAAANTAVLPATIV